MYTQHASKHSCRRLPKSLLLLVMMILTTTLHAQTTTEDTPSSNSSTMTATTSSCTFCHGGAEPTGGTFPGGTSCRDIAASVKSTPASSTTCQDVQIVAFQHCECPALPPEICALCSGDDANDAVYNSLAYPRLLLPDSSGMTCGEAEFLPCEDAAVVLTTEMQWYCGCQQQQQQQRPFECQLCADEEEEFMYPNRILPPHFNSTCQQYDRTLGSTGCGNDNMFPVDVTAYCGCPGSQQQQEASCSLCANYEQGAVQNPLRVVQANTPFDVTCQDMALIASFVQDDPNYCFRLQNFYERDCCGDVDGTTTPAPTVVVTTPPPVAQGINAGSLSNGDTSGGCGERPLLFFWGLSTLLAVITVMV